MKWTDPKNVVCPSCNGENTEYVDIEYPFDDEYTGLESGYFIYNCYDCDEGFNVKDKLLTGSFHP